MPQEPPPASRHDVVIVGAGVSGLATAYWLRRHRPDLDVVVLEAEKAAGGHVVSEVIDGFTVERGPTALRGGSSDTRSVIDELGLGPKVVAAAPAANRRYIVRGGKLVPFPSSPGSALKSLLLSPAGKVRALAEPLVPRGTTADESVSSFLRRRFGAEVDRVFGEGLVSGVVAGDPRRLSMGALFPGLVALERRHGSLLRGLMSQQRDARNGSAGAGDGALAYRAADSGPLATRVDTSPGTAPSALLTFEGGMRALTDALAEALGPALVTGARVTGLVREPEGFSVELAHGAHLVTGQLVLATPAHVTADLLRSVAPAARKELDGIAFAGVAVITLGFASSALAKAAEGFGFLAPRAQGVRSLGVQFTSAVFPAQAPPEAVSLRSIAGGTLDPSFMDLSEQEALTEVRRDLEAVLGITAEPVFTDYRRLPRAIPQYEVGHGARLARLAESLVGLPGLHLAGNSYCGVGLSDCLRESRALAERLARKRAPNPVAHG